MKAKRVRFKDSERESDHPASCKLGDNSAPCEAREDPPMRPAASNEPKTSEFSFFKKLKQDVARSSCRNSLNRKSLPERNAGPSNHSQVLGDSKFKDVKSSRCVKKSTTGEVGSALSPKDAAWESSATPISNKEHDSGRLKSSSVITPCISLDALLSTTANSSVNTESQQKDGDLFSSKRLKLKRQIAKTLFPDADEVPKECNLVLLLLSRLLPENSLEILSQNQQLSQPETKEKCQLHLESNIQLNEASNTRKLVKSSNCFFLDSSVSAAQPHMFWEPLSSAETIEGNDAFTARNSEGMLGHNEWSEPGSSLNEIDYGCWSKRIENRNLLTWDNELNTAGDTSPNIVKNEAYKRFSYDAYDRNWSCRFREQSHYEVHNKSYNSSPAAKSSILMYKDEIHDFGLDRGSQSSPNIWRDSSSLIPFEKLRPSAFNNPRDYTEMNCLNDVEIRKEPFPLLIGWSTDEWNERVRDSTRTTNMEIEIYHPPSYTCSKNLQDYPEPEIYSPQSSTWNGNHWVSPETTPEHRNLLPYTYQDHDTQEQHSKNKELVPISPGLPDTVSYDSEQMNPDDFGLYISRGSSFPYTSQKGSQSMENMMFDKNCPAAEALPYIPRLESGTDLKCISLTGFLNMQYNTCNDNVVELFRPEISSSQFLIANENDLAISQPEHRSMTSAQVPIGQEDLFPLQIHTLMWKDTVAEICDYDRGTTTTNDNLFW